MKRLLLPLLFSLAACSGDSAEPAVQNFDGSWSLQTINTFALPYAISDQNGVRTEVVSEVVTISGSSVVRSYTLRSTAGSTVTQQQYSTNGSYRYDNRHIISYSGEQEAWFVPESDNKITLHWYNMNWVYQRM